MKRCSQNNDIFIIGNTRFFIHTLLEIYDYILKCLIEHKNSLLKKECFLLTGSNNIYNASNVAVATAAVILFLILFL